MLRAAAARLAALGEVAARSSIYATAPVGGPAGQADYLNAVLALDLPGAEAPSLMRSLLAIESVLGRVRRERWGPRLIDLDLLALGAVVFDGPASATADGPGRDDTLVLPHPRLAERAFVLVPLCEIGRTRNEKGSAWVHPVTGHGACAMLAALATGGAGSRQSAHDLGVHRTDLRW